MSEVKVIIVEDHELTRLGIRLTIEKIPGLRVVAETGSGKEVQALVNDKDADLVLMDIGLPDLNGIEVCKRLKETSKVKVVFLTSHEDGTDLQNALAAKGDAFLLKNATLTQLRVAIESALSGALWIDPGVSSKMAAILSLASQLSQCNTENDSRKQRLSAREQEVLNLVVKGMSNVEIARKLLLSVDTVKTHLRHLMEKMNVNDRTKLAVLAVRQGLAGSLNLESTGQNQLDELCLLSSSK